MWGIIPAAGRGSRIQPLAFSKELLPIGSETRDGVERPRAVSEYLIERMILAGVDRICFVISPSKSDIMEYFGATYGPAEIAYVVQSAPCGLCDAIFRAGVLLPRDESVIVGLPDTIWFPSVALAALPNDALSFLLFPVQQPQHFDAVVMEADGRVSEIQVKQQNARSNWIWGAFKMPPGVFHELHALWLARARRDEFIGTLVNEYLRAGGMAVGVRAGSSYVDVGTVHGYHSAMTLLGAAERRPERLTEPHKLAVEVSV